MAVDPASPDPVPTGPGDVSRRSLRAAVATALILVALLTTAIVIGKDAFFFLALSVVLLALYELMDALTRKGRRPATVITLLGGGALMALSYLERPLLIVGAFLTTTVAVILWGLLPGRGSNPASDAAWSLLGVLWIAGGGAAAVSLLTLSDVGVLLLFALVAIVALDDIAAFFFGTNLGRHKVAPSISPGKSWEGLVGGGVVAIAAGAVFGFLMSDLSILDGLMLGGLAACFNPVGDLFESMVKREIGIKDSGTLLPGHGGFLDRLDAIIMCAPAFFIYLRLVVY